MMKKGWDATGGKVVQGAKYAYNNPGEAAERVGKGIKSLNQVTDTLHSATGGSHGTGETDIAGVLTGKYKGKTAELNTVVNLMAKVLNAKTPGESQTALNNLNSNPDYQDFIRNKSPQEKQAFLQQITALAQLQQP